MPRLGRGGGIAAAVTDSWVRSTARVVGAVGSTRTATRGAGAQERAAAAGTVVEATVSYGSDAGHLDPQSSCA